VLSVCGEPQTYAESIVNVCKFYTESPLGCVSGVTGSDLKRRIAAIMVNRVGLRLNLARRAALTIAAMLTIMLPLLAGMLTAPLRVLAEAQGAKAYPKFDVVSVKPCERDAPSQTRDGGGAPITSPGRLYLPCYPLSTMIPEAYLYFADGRAHGLSSLLGQGAIEGGSDWMKTERFLIEATTAQATPAAVMRGPMLQALLEDRFKLKIRRVTREMPIYELVAAKSGVKVAPHTGNDCVIKDEAAWPPLALPAGQRYCGDRSRVEGDRRIREGVLPLKELASLLNGVFDRPVVNSTGITAPVSYRFEYSRVGEPSDRQAAVVAALKNQLGLDVRPSKGPRDFLVIDHVERPTPNDPAFAGDAAFAAAAASLRVPKAGPFVPDVVREQATAAPGPSAPRFEPVTIKPCSQPTPASGGTPASTGGRSGGAFWQAQTSPGYVHWGCVTLAQLVEQAYADQDHPLLNSIERPRRDSLQPKRVRGGPSWTESDMFTIEARTSLDVTSPGLDGSVTRSLARLPATMSQALRATLEDRFQLKVRRATEQQDMYALTIAKSGIKTDKLAVTKPGDCRTRAEYAASARPPMTLDTPNPKICGLVFLSLNAGPEFSGFTLQQLAAYISPILDRFVLNQTGDDRPFNFAFRRAADYGGAGGGGWIISALDELGLRLDATKGPIEYLVIDRVERPRPD
jgi:uncharacterized protein (TIGR03435 family)